MKELSDVSWTPSHFRCSKKSWEYIEILRAVCKVHMHESWDFWTTPVCQWCRNHQIPQHVHAVSHARSHDRNGMNNGGKVSLFHIFWANVLTLHDVNSSPGYQGIEVFE
jgi:hypothetical protein